MRRIVKLSIWLISITALVLFLAYALLLHNVVLTQYPFGTGLPIASVIDLSLAPNYERLLDEKAWREKQKQEKIRYSFWEIWGKYGRDGRQDCTELYTPDEYKDADLDHCDFSIVSFLASNQCPAHKYTTGWTCVGVAIPQALYEDKAAFALVEESIKAPCKVLKRLGATAQNSSVYNYLFCHKGEDYTRFSVYLAVVKNLYEGSISNPKYEEELIEIIEYRNGRSRFMMFVLAWWGEPTSGIERERDNWTLEELTLEKKRDK